MKTNGTELNSVRQMFGVILAIVSPAFTYMQWSSLSGAVETLRNVQQMIPRPVTNTDTATLSSAAYHAAHAQAGLDSMWAPTGFMTLGIAGTVIGIALLTWPLWRRRQSKPAT